MLNFTEKVVNKVVMVDVSKIIPNPAQPRMFFDEKQIEILASSIKENGLLQPITVRKIDDGKYELISGEMRFRAILNNKEQQVPCIIIQTSQKQSAILALLENIQRSDLNFFEEALAYKNLLTEWGITQEEVAKRLGIAQSTIANKIRLLKLTNQEQELVLSYGFNERQARALLKIGGSNDFKAQADYIAKNNLNVQQTDKYIEKLLLTPKSLKKSFPIIKDARIFINTINKALAIMKKSGVNATSQKVETDEYIEFVVKIPRVI